MAQPSILYIMGTGRSGTTILEVLLSDNANVCSTGELSHIFRDGFLNNTDCACAKPFSKCNFWHKVKNKLNCLEHNYHRKAILFDQLDRHKGFLKVIAGCISEKKMNTHEQICRKMFNACYNISGCKIILDSSKYPARALLLKKHFRDNTKIICLTRSPEGLIKSFSKRGIEQPPKSPLNIFLYYSFVLLSCRIVAMMTRQVLFISFEDLLSSPGRVLNKIGDFTGLNMESTTIKIMSNQSFEPGHIVTGNRLRKQKKIYFKQKKPSDVSSHNPKTVWVVLMEIVQKILGF